MRDSAQVVIIGGGIVGCSIAYHLTKMGLKDVILLEKGELTSGSTWHAAGLVGQLRSHRNVTRMLQYSVSLYKTLEAETGLTTGWKQSGCLHLASTQERILELKRGATTARSFGLDLHMITPAEALKLCPILNMEGIIGAAFMPSDGQADPSGLTMAMAKGAMNRGATVEQKTLVTGFEIRNDRVEAVVTDKGKIRCETVVNAAGMWGREIGRMMGVNIPLVPFQHQYLVTEVIEGVPPDMPTLRDKDSLLYYKEEVGGLVMGGYERDGIPWSTRGFRPLRLHLAGGREPHPLPRHGRNRAPGQRSGGLHPGRKLHAGAGPRALELLRCGRIQRLRDRRGRRRREDGGRMDRRGGAQPKHLAARYPPLRPVPPKSSLQCRTDEGDLRQTLHHLLAA
jgi:sarcosine dehydrogenase